MKTRAVWSSFMAQQKKGFIARMLEGKERSEEYARSTLPTNRWQLFWDVFKGNFGKIVKVNLLTLLFCVPLLAVIIFYFLMGEFNSTFYPYGTNLGVGYPAISGELVGLSERLIMQNNLMLYLGVLITSFIAAVGLSGGMYVVRNMVWTEGIFVTNDFWRGIKLNYKNALQTCLFFCVIFFLCGTVIDSASLYLTLGVLEPWQEVFMHIAQGSGYVFIFVAALMSLWMIAMGVNYQVGFWALIKNAFLLFLGTLPQTIFFAALAAIPFLLFLIPSSFFLVVGIFILLLFGIAYALLVWLDFAQWVFDKYINPKIKGAKTGRGLYNKDGSAALTGDDSASAIEYQRTIVAYGRSKLVARPIKPIDDDVQMYELPQSFSREDLKRLRESKQNIVEDSEAYAEEHKNDFRYVEYNKQFDEREKALQEQEEGKKKKKLKPPKPKKGEEVHSSEDEA